MKAFYPNNPASLGFRLVLLASVLFSAKAVFIKMAYIHGVPPVVLMTLRMLFSFPFFLGMAVFAYFQSPPASAVPLRFGEKLAVGGLGLLGYYLASIFDLYGLQFVSAGMERLILFIYPTFVVLISALAYRRKLDRSLFLPLGLSYAGIALAFYGDLHIHGEGGYFGAFLIALSALFYACFLVGNGRLVHRVGPSRLTAYAMMVSSAAIFIHFAIQFPLSALVVSREVYGLAIVIAVFSTVIPSYLLGYGIKLVGSDRTAVISSIGPVSTLVLGWLLLREVPTYFQVAGMGLVIWGGIRLSRNKA